MRGEGQAKLKDEPTQSLRMREYIIEMLGWGGSLNPKSFFKYSQSNPEMLLSLFQLCLY